MFDHVLTFDDKAAALAALEPLGLAYEGEFDGSRCVVVSLVVSPATVDDSDPDNPVVTPAVVLPGYSVVAATTAFSAPLRDLDGSACRVIADREAANNGDPAFIVYTAADIDPSALASITVSPAFAGCNYPFGNIPT